MFGVLLAAVTWLSLQDSCQGNPLNASCRIYSPSLSGRYVGSGTCVGIVDGYVWTITNAHVIRKAYGPVSVQWYWKGWEGNDKMPAEIKLVRDEEAVDLAILRQSVAAFGGRLPGVGKLPPEDFRLQKNAIVYTVGCPHGSHPTLLECRIIGPETWRAGIQFSPRPEQGRSGSGIWSADGKYLVALLDSWSRDNPNYGGAIWHTQLRKCMESAATKYETRLFDGSFGGRICNGGSCPPQRQQQQTQQGAAQVYPDLPPLAGIIDETPLPPPPTIDMEARTGVTQLTDDLDALKRDLAEKEMRLQALFGEDYGLLKEIADNAAMAKSDADLAKARADDANRGLSGVTDTLFKLPQKIQADIDTAVTAKIPEDIDQWGFIRDGYCKLQKRLEKIDGIAEDGSVADSGGFLGRATSAMSTLSNPWSLVWKIGLPFSAVLAALLLIWVRIEQKIKNNEKTVAEKVLSRISPELGEKVGSIVEAGASLPTRIRDDVDDMLTSIGGLFRRKTEELKQAEALGKLRTILDPPSNN